MFIPTSINLPWKPEQVSIQGKNGYVINPEQVEYFKQLIKSLNLMYAEIANVINLEVSDTAYGVSWDEVKTIAPSKNAVYDKVQLLSALFPAALGAANLKQFMNAAGTAPEWANGMNCGLFTRNIEVASGDQVITGVNFKPSQLIFLMSMESSTIFSLGFDNGSISLYVSLKDSVVWNNDTTYSILAYHSIDNYYKGLISALGSDGFTITWTKIGTPTGTIDVHYLALR